MKNLLAFTAFLAAGFLLGRRRARKAGPVDVMSISVEVDTSRAMPQLYRLQKQAEKTSAAVLEAAQALEATGFPLPPAVSLNEALGCQAACASAYRERATA